LYTKIQKNLSEESFIVHDSMPLLEHSLEMIVSFLNKKNSTVEIVPILITYTYYK
jgi:predicted class III extradiol MEMO1 family dioxygenase